MYIVHSSPYIHATQIVYPVHVRIYVFTYILLCYMPVFTYILLCSVLAVAYRPDGAHVAVATLDGNISCWDVVTALQCCSIDSRRDLGYSRQDNDKISAKKSSLSKSV